MKRLKLLAALLALTIGLAGCGKGSSASSSKPEKMLDGDNMIASSSAKQEYTEPEDVTYMRLLAGEDEYRACVLYLGGSYEITTDVQQAYTDASFVFAQMRVGGYAMREQDEKIPLRHGVVGQETCGAGGSISYGIRSIPGVFGIVEAAKKYSPNCWILNYSNPAAIVSEACRKLRPKARIINICDMPIAIIDVVAAAMGIQNKKEIVYDYFGLNHFGWFTSIQYRGEDLMPKLRAYIKEKQILLPESYLKGMGALTSSASQNRHTKGSWYYVWKGEYEIMENFPEYLPNTYLNYYLQAKEFVEQKPGGLDEPVAQGGRNFSGGQRQRLTIARALVRKPEILILDDSASALDFATDAALRKALARLPWKPTVVLISQRVSSIRQADAILVLDDAHLAGVGTHEALMRDCAVYREIALSQEKEAKA